jgi:signal transduction histidine kinase
MTQSLRLRLPLLISSLIAVSLVAFLAVSFRQIRRELLHAGQARAQAASDQLGALLAQSAQQQVTDTQRAAQDPAVRAYLERPLDAEAETKARQRLTALAAAGQPPIEVWDAAGQRRLQGGLARADRAVPPTPPITRPSAEGVSPFQAAGPAVYWDVVAAVPADGPGSGAHGFVVSRRILSRGGNPDAIKKLVGAGAAIRLGSPSGIWSDLSTVVPSPGFDIRPGTFEAASGGEPWVGAAAAVRGTPWLVLVEFPRRTIIAPARAFLFRMLMVAAILVLAAAAAAYTLSARITRPLAALTRGAEAIADGRFEERVEIARRDEIGRLAVAFATMASHVQAARADLETRVIERTRAVVDLNTQLEHRVAELNTLSGELEAFTYSVSHDLRAPLRHVAGFARLLEKRAGSALDAESNRYLQTIIDAAGKMGRLVDDLLGFSRMSRTEMQAKRVDLDAVIRDVLQESERDAAGRRINWTTHPLPPVIGDPAMLRIAFANLVSNAVKYTAPRDVAEIEIGTKPATDGERVLYVRDNGVGFDMAYAGKLFGVFQRLHAAEQFDGTGIGLANVRRIIQRHGGQTWAEGAVDGGATFFVSLPDGGPPGH